MAEFKPTEEQQEIIDAARAGGKNLMCVADAGCAKTTTLKLLGPVLRGGVLGLAFNKSTAKELGAVLPGNFSIKTANGLGHGAWIRGNPGVAKWDLQDRKLGGLITELAKEEKLKLNSDQWGAVKDLVTKAMQAGLVPGNIGRPLIEDDDESWRDLAEDCWIPEDEQEVLTKFSRRVLVKDIELAKRGIISFDDQIYCSVCLGGRFTQYEDVIVDEAQDLNQLNHEMIRLSTRSNGRIIAVGDPKQAIYAFRGALGDSMGKLKLLKSEDSWLELPLHLTFRCSKVVVQKQQHHAPGFRAAEQNREGKYLLLPKRRISEDGEKNSWTWADLQGELASGAKIFILCRNNAPLMSMAFKLIRRRIGPAMLGRNLGKNLLSFSRKLLPSDETTKDKCAGVISEWREIEVRTAEAAGKSDNKIEEIHDRAECLQAVLDDAEVRTAGEMRSVLGNLFEREVGQVTLGTGHKAKGLEADCVVHLDPWRIPSKQAKKAQAAGNGIPMQQDLNLHYVIDTRTRDVLVDASLEDFK